MVYLCYRTSEVGSNCWGAYTKLSFLLKKAQMDNFKAAFHKPIFSMNHISDRARVKLLETVYFLSIDRFDLRNCISVSLVFIKRDLNISSSPESLSKYFH